ncbi:MAG TPA: amidase family protein [Cellulomonas sp.]
MREFDREYLTESARRLGTGVAEHEWDEMARLADWMTATIDEFMAAAPPYLPAPHVVPASRRVLGPPRAGEDPLNAIRYWTEVRADPTEVTGDLLAGKNVVVKDLIQVAGLPISVGTRVLDGFVPVEDAPVVDRVLRAGATITAVTNMEGMAYGGGGESGDFGATRNPFDPTRSTSGSSGGSAASLFYDGVDIAFGTDQGGSVRLPAAWCGVLGLKPTHALVPYSGIASHDATFDHVGPMTRTVDDLARAMQVVQGADPSDHRQAAGVPRLDFLAAHGSAPTGYAGRTLAVLEEAVEPDGTPERDAALAAFAGFLTTFERLGGRVVRVSVPAHRLSGGVLFAAMLEGVAATLHGNGDGYGRTGRYSVETRRAIGRGMAASGTILPHAYRMAAILGESYRRRYFGEVYATAQRIIPALRGAYDTALEGVDALVMPTAPLPAMELRPDAGIFERQTRSFSSPVDTPAHNATGHPALSLPAAQVDGLPFGIQLVGRRFEDDVLIGLAQTWESQVGWQPGDPEVHGGRRP